MKNIIMFIVLSIPFINTVSAQIINEDTISVGAGWNMVGSLYNGLTSDILRCEPESIIVSSFFTYNPGGGYEAKDTLKKGGGYWIKVNQDGILIFHLAGTNYAPNPPSSPFPADSATGVDTNITLSWTCNDPEDDPLIYDVYFGTDNPPITKVSSEQVGSSLERTGLTKSTVYYWRIVAKDNHTNSTSGPIWRLTTFGPHVWTCGDTINYESKIYNTVLIGSQCWLKENLDIGVMISGDTGHSNNGIIEKYCYNNQPQLCETYGGLYQWNEAMQYTTLEGAQGICPPGWRIPSILELDMLGNTVGYNGKALLAIGQGSGTNTSGFSAFLGGRLNSNANFIDIGTDANLLSSTKNPGIGASYLDINTAGAFLFSSGSYNMVDAYSVRCLHD